MPDADLATAATTDQVAEQREDDPGSQEDHEDTETEASVADKVGVQSGQLVGLRGTWLVVTTRHSVLEEAAEEAAVTPAPAVVEL